MKRKLSLLLITLALLVAASFATVSALSVDTRTAASRCGKCGDGQCVASCGETSQTCPKDCGVPSED